ncbi:MAG: rhamnulokinase family protein [Armatimonadota bacterium]
MSHRLLAFDLGASSGRSFVGTLDGGRLDIAELTRFENGTVSVRGGLYWDVIALLQQIVRGIEACVSVASAPESIGIDTWGVDFGLLAADGSLVSVPRAYRDPRLEGAMEEFLKIVPRERVYGLTGIQLMRINTLFQLYAMVRDRWPLLSSVTDLLMMPDLFNYLLTGEKRAEFTISTTSQLYNPTSGGWAGELLDSLGLSPTIMQQIVQPGTVVGSLDSAASGASALPAVPVVATASHDTASAVAAAPGEGKDWAYISSGTWSLMGVESDHPIITPQSLALNFSNEGGIGGAYRVLKNIPGLWLVQQCRQAWAKDRLYSYEELTNLAAAMTGDSTAAAGPAARLLDSSTLRLFCSLIAPDDPSFVNPPDMPLAIQQFCQRTAQPAPEGVGEVMRCILVSLALRYRQVLDELRQLHSHPINRIHIIGGGSRNELLCQLAADATGIPVLAGPAEATVVGNLLVQAMGLGHIASPAAVREVVRASFAPKRYEPRPGPGWDDAYQRFRGLRAGGPQE